MFVCTHSSVPYLREMYGSFSVACRMHQQLTFASNGTVSATSEGIRFSEAVICVHVSHLTVIKCRVDIFVYHIKKVND